MGSPVSKPLLLQEVPDATAVMDPFHVVRLAGDALYHCRRRVQQDLHGRRGRKNDPLYQARRTLHTGADLLPDEQQARITALFDEQVHGDRHVPLEATWGIYQRMITAYRHPDRAQGKKLMAVLIESVGTGVPNGLAEITTFGRTLKQRGVDVLAYFDRPGTSNGPTEAINGRLEHLRGSALGFTTSPAACSKRAASDPDSYTVVCEEPAKSAREIKRYLKRAVAREVYRILEANAAAKAQTLTMIA